MGQKKVKKSDSDFKQEALCKNNKVTVLGAYVNQKTNILVKCNFCGCEFFMNPSSILRGSGHKPCSSKIVGRKIAKDQDTFVLEAKMKNPSFDVIGKYINNHTNIRIKCCHCGYEKNVITENLLRQIYKCPICSDGTSFPNRLVSATLIDSNIDFEPEKKFDWSGKYRYDFYIENINTIIEVNGAQHYDRAMFKSVEKQKNIDDYKMNLALQNGIEKYIIIDASKSDFDFIFNNLMHSEIGGLLSNPNKDNIKSMCFMSSSKIISFVKYYNEGITRNVDLQPLLGVCKDTVTNYKKIALSNNLI